MRGIIGLPASSIDSPIQCCDQGVIQGHRDELGDGAGRRDGADGRFHRGDHEPARRPTEREVHWRARP